MRDLNKSQVSVSYLKLLVKECGNKRYFMRIVPNVDIVLSLISMLISIHYVSKKPDRYD